jgi:hypothetical protein
MRQLEKASSRLVLPDAVLDIINSLSTQMGIAVTPTPAKRRETLNGLLNKLTYETYKEVAPQIEDIVASEAYETLYKVVSSNAFYAPLYAELCETLVKRHGDLQTFLEVKAMTVTVTALGERAHTSFIAALVNRSVLDVSVVQRLSAVILSSVQEFMDDADHKERIGEWVEHLFLLVSANVAMHRTLSGAVTAIAALNPAQHEGLCNKTLFRLMDVIDLFEVKAKKR